MNYMFYCCISLSSFPDISKWNTSNLKEAKGIFEQCISVTIFPDISNGNISNIDMSYLFYNCYALSFVPNISEFHKSNRNNSLVNKCFSLLNIEKFEE